MNKKQLIEAISNEAGDDYSKAYVSNALDALTKVVSRELSEGREVALPGLCKFDAGWRGPRKGTNPRTGETLGIAAKWVPKITPVKALRDAVAELGDPQG